MKSFFGDEVLLNTEEAVKVYKHIKDLPIIDYHCHLSQKAISDNPLLDDLATLWLGADHYKWRVMRLCGVDEYYITGDAPIYDKFVKFCEIMPKLVGGPVYYWAHFELKQIFGINLEINKVNAKEIYDLANSKLKDMHVRDLLKHFGVKYIATTDDPVDTLEYNGLYDGITVSPTFRGDKLLTLDSDYLDILANVTGISTKTLDGFKEAVISRLDYFVNKNCRIVDLGFENFPSEIFTLDKANIAYSNLSSIDSDTKDGLVGHIFNFLLREFKKRDMLVQLHFAVKRNINTPMFNKVGRDAGFDVMSKEINLDNLILLLDSLSDEERPRIVLYTLNPNTICPLSCISGAYRNVLIGAAWWFNDTVLGIKNNLELISEYAVLGTNLGMLTDSRSFSSYSRFDFFRRILADFIGNKVNKGEYSLESAYKLAEDICYNNISNILGVN